MSRIVSVASVLLLVAGVVSAHSVDDVIRLAKAGVNNDVIVAYVQASPNRFDLTTEQILLLKDEKISDAVTVAMLRHKPEAAAFTIAPREEVEAAVPAPRRRIVREVEADDAAEERTIIRERVVERPVERVVYETSPVVYASSYYPYSYASYGCYPHYGYRGYYGGYYSRPYVSVGFSFGGHYGHGYRGYGYGYRGYGYRGSYYGGYRPSYYGGYRSSYYGGYRGYGRGFSGYGSFRSGGRISGGFSGYRAF
jgi:hypothetical protein